MSYVSIGRAPTREAYEQVNKKLGLEDSPPAGLILQTAAEAADGVRIVSVWESQESMAAFEQRLLPLLESVPGAAAAPEVLEAFQVVRGR